MQLNLTGLVGNNQTYGNEAVVSAVHDGLSLSAGQFHYQTNGFRANNDLRHDIYNVFAQAALSPTLNVQAEVRSRRTESGDLNLNFDPSFFRRDLDFDLDQDTARLGARYSPSPKTDVIASLIYTDRNDKRVEGASENVTASDNRLYQTGRQGEAQAIFRGTSYNIQAGVGAYSVDDRTKSIVQPFRFTRNGDTEHFNAYVYTNVVAPADVAWTLGLGYDYYEEGDSDFSKLSPKLGARWSIVDDVQLRASLARSVKPGLLANQTIQPTQLAGFNQFFDDSNGTESWLYALGLDARLSRKIYSGVEVSRRHLDETGLNGDDTERDSFNEDGARAYLYWALADEWALTGELLYDQYDRGGRSSSIPSQVTTYALPVGIRYFSSGGVLAGAGVSFVRQEVEYGEITDFPQGEDNFYVVDAMLGYRLPHRRGLVSIEVQNLLDNDFNYQDDNYRKVGNEPALSPFIPDQTILGRVTLSF